ncbi:hypothetical protein ACHAWO_001832 [Cyclotella atomus]|uniref:Uncharacterized protein n=1 Tax=Cyclotella atomus TaxID=382360 RepID=A0ABD3NAT0_9STRA
MSLKRCTCSPHPRIDLTNAYLQYHRGPTPNDLQNSCDQNDVSDTSKRVREACSSHGCFHVSICYPVATADAKSITPIGVLAKRKKEVEYQIESLFSSSFLIGAISNAQDVNSLGIYENICNGKTAEVSFCNSGERSHFGTFRGRSAESGDEESFKPEPKLSWEFQRCLSADRALQDCYTNNDPSINEQWKLLPRWTEAMHSMAATVIYLLGIPPCLALQEDSCSCSQTPSKHSDDFQQSKCNIDLLRVFRYDSIESNDASHGSSAHSDWGSLTIVWQDDKGGLQTYCEACDKWSDVDATNSTNDESKDAENSSDVVINLFVHVGDFLSLISSTPNNTNSDSLCRRSLVYFAYPPPGVSLRDAQKVVGSLASSTSNNSSNLLPGHSCLKMYSVLHDQSVQAESSSQSEQLPGQAAVEMAYNEMLGISFDQVIAKKWGQVQRK